MIKFVNLHVHTTFSIFDGFGFPEQIYEAIAKKGMEACAITDHGNMNALSYQHFAIQSLKKKNIFIKPIYGCEAYYVPSIKELKEKEDIKDNIKEVVDGSESFLEAEDIDEEAGIKKKIRKTHHMLLLAKNEVGLKNLFKLVSLSYSKENFYRRPRIDKDMLRQCADGLIASSACLGGVLAKDYWDNKENGLDSVVQAMNNTHEEMISIFGDNWKGELQWNLIKEQHELNRCVIESCKKKGVQLITTCDSHYPTKEDWKNRELYKRLGWANSTRAPEWAKEKMPESISELKYELYPKTGEEVYESYKKYSHEVGESYDDETILQSIEATYNISESIQDIEINKKVYLPSFLFESKREPDTILYEECRRSLRELGLSENKQYNERFKREFEIIKKRGFVNYFLTMRAICIKANKVMMTGAARGSAGGSLVSYLLGITQIDPIQWGTQFERFMTEDETSGYPDIDFDVASPAELKEMLANDWGKDSIAYVTNYNSLQLKSLIKDISKFYEIPFKEVNDVTFKMFEEATALAKKEHDITVGVYVPTFEEVKKYSKTLKEFFIKYPIVAEHVEALQGQIRSVSRHAGGVIIADDLGNKMPLIRQSNNELFQTPWAEGQNVRHLEPFGFIKFDILGLESLSMIKQTIEKILQNKTGNPIVSFNSIKEFYDCNLSPKINHYEDPHVWETIFHNGKWAGIFQFSNEGAQEFCKKVKPNNIIELSTITSLYRPGPLAAKADELYLKCKEGIEKVKYDHSLLEPILSKTYGQIVFQEQIAEIANILGKDITLSEGNKLRKILTKKGTGAADEVRDKIYKKFEEGCLEKGISHKIAAEIMDKLQAFSAYGFNFSHAVAYSIISYQCAYLSTYYPDEWISSFLDKEPEKSKEKAINLARQYGYKILFADINKSDDSWKVINGKELVQPLSSLKGIGDSAIKQIIARRPYNKIEDLIYNPRISYSKVNKKTFNVLIKSQALNSLIDDRFDNLKHFWHVVSENKPKDIKKFNDYILKTKGEKDFTQEEKIEFIIGFSGTFPFHLVMDEKIMNRLIEKDIPPLSEFSDEKCIVWGVVRDVEIKYTKNNKEYYLVTILDSNFNITSVKCWGINSKTDKLFINHPYIIKPKFEDPWGFSTLGKIGNSWKMIG